MTYSESTSASQIQYATVKAILFDFDGTLTQPGGIDFAGIRQAINCPPQGPIIEHINAIVDDMERQEAWEHLANFEDESAIRAVPNHGAEDVIRSLQSMGLKLGLVSRNSNNSIVRSLENFADISIVDFEVIVSRDEPVAPKPSGEGIVLAARRLNVHHQNILYVGDYIFDIQAGKDAGVRTVFLTNGRSLPRFEDPPDHVIDRLDGVLELLDMTM